MKNTFRKTLSVLLTAMMIFSCLAVAAPMKANALPANDNTYATGDKYGTLKWTGTGDRWFQWTNPSNSGDFVRIYYPSHIYLDISETIQSAGYHFDISWDLGNSTNYRILLAPPVWGDYRDFGGMPAKYYTMTNIFSDYSVDASTVPYAPIGTYGPSINASNCDLRIVGFGYADQGTDQYSENGVTQKRYILWKNNNNTPSPVSTVIYPMGTPSSYYVGKTTEFNTTGGSVANYGFAQNWNGSWVRDNSTAMFNTKGSTSSYMEGQWIEMQWFVTVYDKSALNSEIMKAGQIIQQQSGYDSYVVNGSYRDLVQNNSDAQKVIIKREQTQNDIDNMKRMLYESANIYYGASNAQLLSLAAEAEGYINSADYEVKYFENSRENLERVLSSVKTLSYYSSVPTYNAYNDSSAGSKAASDQSAINSAVNELQGAINNLKSSVAYYTVIFNKADGTIKKVNGAYGFTFPETSVPALSVVESDAVNHYTVSWDKEINYTITGNDEYNEVITTEPHEWNDWYTTVYPSCSNEGQMYRTCKICNYRQDDTIPTTAHTELPPVISDEVEATCKTTGSYVSSIYCDECSNLVSRETVTVPKKQHTAGEKVKENVINATCTTDGSYTEVVYCTVCGDKVSEKQVVVGAAHTNSEPYVVTEPSTCSKQGTVKTTVFCTECLQILEEKTEKLPLADHTPGEAKKENEIDAGCGTPGSYDMVTRCSVCNDILDSDHFETEAGSHNWDEWETVSLPDCEKDGLQKRVCKNDSNHIEQKPIPSEGHKYTSFTYPPTCTSDGYTEYTCSVCNDVYIGNTVTTNGHTPKAAVTEKEVEATCTVAAYHEEVVYCEVCDAEISRTPVKGTTIPHTEEVIKAVPPTCTEDGWTAGVKCSVCNTVLTAPEVDPSEGHTPKAAVTEKEVEATCTVAAYHEEVVYCEVCDTEISRTPVKGTTIPHTPKAAVIEKEVEASCKQAAYHEEVVYCEICTTELSRTPVSGEKLPHSEEAVAGKAATCTEAGLTDGVKCSVCGEFTTAQTVIPAKGHKLGEWMTEAEATCTAKGLQYRECADCDYVETRDIDKTEHNYNEDNVCTDCGAAHNCKHLCHRQHNFFARFVWTIIRYICSIFGVSKTCSCGEAHY